MHQASHTKSITKLVGRDPSHIHISVIKQRMKRNISHQFNHSFNHHFLSLSLSFTHTLFLNSFLSVFLTFLAFTSAPSLMSDTTQSLCPFSDAQCNGVLSKEISENHKNQSNIKTYPLRNQVKVTSKYPNEFVRLQSFKAHTLSDSLSFSCLLYTSDAADD